MNSLTLLTHCALSCAFKRLENPKYDRNRTVYRYFSQHVFKLRGREKKMAALILKRPQHAAYVFDQYFGLIFDYPAGPDAHPLADIIAKRYEEAQNVANV